MAAAALLLVSVILQLFVRSFQTSPADDFYIAAVVEYAGIQDSNLTPIQIAEQNVEKYAEIMKKAAENKVDIIVFPEIGLFAFDHSLFVEVPDPADKVVPAVNGSFHPVLKNLSQAALSNQLYVVVNLHELYKSGNNSFKYNTNVVFDRKGTVIARYRKYNLFGENYLNRQDAPEYVRFTTDFGVTFGTFTCFDIIFEEPAIGLVEKYNVTDFVFPTAWFSELPLYIAIQTQSAWAYANNVNLLASGYNNMSSGNTGSGIYAGRNGPIVYIESERSGTKILIGKVPKMTNKEKAVVPERGDIIPYGPSETKSAPILHEDLKIYATKLIKPDNLTATKEEYLNITGGTGTGLKKDFSLEERLCQSDFCCNFNLSFSVSYYPKNYSFTEDVTFNKSDAFYHFNYRLIVLDGVRSYLVGNKSGQQVCAITPCLEDTLESCGVSNKGNTPRHEINHKDLGKLVLYSTEFQTINISGDFHNRRVLYLPSLLVSSEDSSTFGQLLQPDRFHLVVENSTTKAHVSLELRPTKFASGGIYARLYERDNEPSSANFLTINMLLCCSLPLIVLYIMISVK
ncbi:vanin-like protein 1 isoform X2 [Rhodnius prolixus]|uniref:Putative biotinidase n=2 Tax=Rhodnius prolixus TaxID=13249 RepID=R4FM46_RHOPR